jgi:hypothetical protein
MSHWHLNYAVIGGILIHSPGLWVKIQYEESIEFCTSLLSAAGEGVFLLWLIEWLLYKMDRPLRRLTARFGVLSIIIYRMVTAISGFMIALFIVSAITSDAKFRMVTGNISPSSGQVASGYENGIGHLAAQLSTDFGGTVISIVVGYSTFIGGTYLYLQKSGFMTTTAGHSTRRPIFWPIYLVFLLNAIASMEGLYCPVVFAYFSVLFGNLGSTDDSFLTHVDMNMVQRNIHSKSPNVIFIQHESLDGKAVLKDDKGKLAMPFFHSMLQQDPDMFVFEHARSVSGNTIDAMPALLKGCLPLTGEALKFVNEPGASLAYDFFRNGYNTASFCSRALNKSIKTGQWRNLYDLFVGGMNNTFDPVLYSMPLDNNEATNDQRFLPYFADWVQNELPFYGKH